MPVIRNSRIHNGAVCVTRYCLRAMDWTNKVVLITGASSGIGRALALELARRGAQLGLVARRTELLAELAAEISSESSGAAEVLLLSADVQDADAMRHAGLQLSAAFGHVDMLIANAGRGVTNPAAEFSAAELASVI